MSENFDLTLKEGKCLFNIVINPYVSLVQNSNYYYKQCCALTGLKDDHFITGNDIALSLKEGKCLFNVVINPNLTTNTNH